MVKRSRGTLSTYTRALTSKRKYGITAIQRQFNIGDKVVINIKGGHSGMPHPRYRGRHGTIVGKSGTSYIVEVRDGTSMKRLISRPVHLDPVE
ncbi:MAG: 50S ribosomal protein L21e [Candidatus Micrarchaeia archaeon]